MKTVSTFPEIWLKNREKPKHKIEADIKVNHGTVTAYFSHAVSIYAQTFDNFSSTKSKTQVVKIGSTKVHEETPYGSSAAATILPSSFSML